MACLIHVLAECEHGRIEVGIADALVTRRALEALILLPPHADTLGRVGGRCQLAVKLDQIVNERLNALQHHAGYQTTRQSRCEHLHRTARLVGLLPKFLIVVRYFPRVDRKRLHALDGGLRCRVQLVPRRRRRIDALFHLGCGNTRTLCRRLNGPHGGFGLSARSGEFICSLRGRVASGIELIERRGRRFDLRRVDGQAKSCDVSHGFLPSPSAASPCASSH